MFSIPEAYTHQLEASSFRKKKGRILDLSDPGTGKTRASIDAIDENSRTLVLAPKSILQAAWGNDIEKFRPTLSYMVAEGLKEKKISAFNSGAQVIITNHDSAKMLYQNPKLLVGFKKLIVDEGTAFKNPKSQRSKAIKQLAKLFLEIELLTGTPIPNGICDMWHQVLLVDDGERLGKTFTRFKAMYTDTIWNGYKDLIIDKESAVEDVFNKIKDITIRNRLEDCIDIPEKRTQDVEFTLNHKHYGLYKELQKQTRVQLESGEVDPVNSAVLANKLLQLASGAVYTEGGSYEIVDRDRYELIVELAAQTPSVIAFFWKHQRELILEEAAKKKLKFGLIDGTVKGEDRLKVVEDFQAGKLDAVLAHPQSAAHGLTLTYGESTIWSGPTWNAEHYEQFNARIYRAGQTKKTRTVHIAAASTMEGYVYEKLATKTLKQDSFLEYFV